MSIPTNKRIENLVHFFDEICALDMPQHLSDRADLAKRLAERLHLLVLNGLFDTLPELLVEIKELEEFASFTSFPKP